VRRQEGFSKGGSWGMTTRDRGVGMWDVGGINGIGICVESSVLEENICGWSGDERSQLEGPLDYYRICGR